MCACMPRPDHQTVVALRRAPKRKMRDIQERQVESVCLGIEHLIKRRRVDSAGSASKRGNTRSLPRGRHHETSCGLGGYRGECRLCESTLRVLSIAKAHASQAHDRANCEACRMWAKVTERCASLRVLNANGIAEGKHIDAAADATAATAAGDGDDKGNNTAAGSSCAVVGPAGVWELVNE